MPGQETSLSDADMVKFEAIVKQHAQEAAKAISDEFRRSTPKQSNPWITALTVIGTTVAVIGSMAYLVSKDDEKTATLLSEMEKTVVQNTNELSGLRDDIGGLKVSFAKLDGSFTRLDENFERLDVNFEKLDGNFQELLEEIKGKP